MKMDQLNSSSSSSSASSDYHGSLDQEEDSCDRSKTLEEPITLPRTGEEQFIGLTRKQPVVKRSRRSSAVHRREVFNLELSLQDDAKSREDQFDANTYKQSNRRSSLERRLSYCRQRRKSTSYITSSIAEDSEFSIKDNRSSQVNIERPHPAKQRGASISIPHERKKSSDLSVFANSLKNSLKSKRNFSVDDLWQNSEVGQEIKKSFSQLQDSILISNKSQYKELIKPSDNSYIDGRSSDSSSSFHTLSSGSNIRSTEVGQLQSHKQHRRSKDSSGRRKKLSLPVLWRNTDMMSHHRHEPQYDDQPIKQKEKAVDSGNKPKSFDAVVFDMLRVAPEEYARQLTLLDWPTFCQITPEELSGCGWVTKDKLKLAPHICAMTRRFNHTSFWVIHEILHASSTKTRAEVVTLFIKVAKKLYELNSIHSLMAVIQSLNSSSIIRLSKTWMLVAKTHRMTFERLHRLVKEDDNRVELRSHMESVRLPCIPFLGMYLTDVMYINSAHPDNGGLGNHERSNKMNNIFRVISEFQQSKYDHLQPQPHVRNYLTNVHYIEELQKFLEEDNYKLSLKLEPSQPNSLHRNNHMKVEARLSVDTLLRHHSDAHNPRDKFIPSHRKTRSLGRDSAFGTVSLRHKSDHSKTPKRGSWYSRGRQKESTVWYLSPTKGFSSDNLNFSGSLNRGVEPLPTVSITTSLLDDSIISVDPAPSSTPASSSSSCTRIPVASSNGSLGSSRSNSGSEFSEHDDSSSWERSFDISSHDLQTCTFEGCLKRKCILKLGKKPSMSSWSKYWVSICDQKLVYFAPKHLKASERHHFKSRPCKVVSIHDWMVLSSNDPSRMDCFQLNNPSSGNLYKFQCDSKDVVLVWVKRLEEAIKGHPQPERDLINLDDN